VEVSDINTGQLSGHNDITASMGRLGTAAFTQEAGMDRNISIRGLSSDYSQVLVNGMPLLATSTSIDARGPVNNSRSFDFNILPQGLFRRVKVIKSGDARTPAGSLSGIVDLRLSMPLDDIAENKFSRHWLAVQGENNVRNSTDGIAVAAGVQQLAEDKHSGWMVGISYRRRGTQGKGFSTVRWRAADWGEQPQFSEQQAQLASGEVFSPRHNRYDILNRERQTLGASAALQWRDKK